MRLFFMTFNTIFYGVLVYITPSRQGGVEGLEI
jgi:hypothetical protein